MGFIGGALTHNQKSDLSRIEVFKSLCAGDQLASRGKDAGNFDKIEWRNARHTQSLFEAGQLFLVLAVSLG